MTATAAAVVVFVSVSKGAMSSLVGGRSPSSGGSQRPFLLAFLTIEIDRYRVSSTTGPAVQKREFGVQAQKSHFVCPHQQHLRHFSCVTSYFCRLKLNRFQSFLFFFIYATREPHITSTLYRSAATDEYYSLNRPNQQQREERCRYGLNHNLLYAA